MADDKRRSTARPVDAAARALEHPVGLLLETARRRLGLARQLLLSPRGLLQVVPLELLEGLFLEGVLGRRELARRFARLPDARLAALAERCRSLPHRLAGSIQRAGGVGQGLRAVLALEAGGLILHAPG